MKSVHRKKEKHQDHLSPCKDTYRSAWPPTLNSSTHKAKNFETRGPQRAAFKLNKDSKLSVLIFQIICIKIPKLSVLRLQIICIKIPNYLY